MKRAIVYLKITAAGIVASFLMYVLIYLGIYQWGVAPFNIPPSAAFLYNLGVTSEAYALVLHFGYGILWSFVFVITFEGDLSIAKAVGMSVVLWLFMMVVYSPLIGWGIFGTGYAHYLSPAHPLHLNSGLSYPLSTLLIHLVYGTVVGYLDTTWINPHGTKSEGQLS